MNAGRVDAYYTPTPVASTLAATLVDGQRSIGRAADFAVGSGVLLDHLAKYDPSGEYFGTDVDSNAVRRLRSRRPTWQVGRCNFLDEESHRRCSVTRNRLPFDTIALNPPFSYRGGSVTKIDLDGIPVRCSPAASFIGLASRYTHARSEMAALVPTSSVYAERDSEFWRLMSASWSRSIIAELPGGWLTGTRASAVILHLKRHERDNPEPREAPDAASGCYVTVRVIRGCTPMYKVEKAKAGSPMLHTTGLTRKGPVSFSVKEAQGRQVRGPAVVFPRVGQPVGWKVQLYLGDAPILLSDCVIGLECGTREEAERVHELIVDKWESVKKAWNGSCAPYVTMEKLRLALAKIGIGVGSA